MHKFTNQEILINQLGPFEKPRIIVVKVSVLSAIGSKSQGGLVVKIIPKMRVG
jgi:hypothetical protein